MSLLGAIKDKQFRRDVGQGLIDAANRGVIGGLLGGPVDLATMALRPFGYSQEKPIGGSEWIGDKLQQAGIVSSNRNPIAEGLAGVAIPAAAMRAAPALFAAEQAALRNAAVPTRLSKQAGAVWVPLQKEIDAARMAATPREITLSNGSTATIVPRRSAYGSPSLNADVNFSSPNNRLTYSAGSNFQERDVPQFISNADEALKVRAARSEVAAGKNNLYNYIQAQRGLLDEAAQIPAQPEWVDNLTRGSGGNQAGADWWAQATKNDEFPALQSFADEAMNQGLFKYGPASSAKSASDVAKHYGLTAGEADGLVKFSGGNGSLDVMNDGAEQFVRSLSAGSAGKKDGGGNKLYQAAMNWGANNKKVFAPDPRGISDINEVRKIGNELSSQIRNGRPTAVMNSPGVTGLAGPGELWKAEAKLAKQRLPVISGVKFDGQNFNLGDDEIVSMIASKDPSFKKGVGLMTAKRVAIQQWIKDSKATPKAAKAAAAALAAAGSGSIFAETDK